jgi:hypothetical protein
VERAKKLESVGQNGCQYKNKKNKNKLLKIQK